MCSVNYTVELSSFLNSFSNIPGLPNRECVYHRMQSCLRASELCTLRIFFFFFRGSFKTSEVYFLPSPPFFSFFSFLAHHLNPARFLIPTRHPHDYHFISIQSAYFALPRVAKFFDLSGVQRYMRRCTSDETREWGSRKRQTDLLRE